MKNCTTLPSSGTRENPFCNWLPGYANSFTTLGRSCTRKLHYSGQFRYAKNPTTLQWSAMKLEQPQKVDTPKKQATYRPLVHEKPHISFRYTQNYKKNGQVW